MNFAKITFSNSGLKRNQHFLTMIEPCCSSVSPPPQRYKYGSKVLELGIANGCAHSCISPSPHTRPSLITKHGALLFSSFELCSIFHLGCTTNHVGLGCSFVASVSVCHSLHQQSGSACGLFLRIMLLYFSEKNLMHKVKYVGLF